MPGCCGVTAFGRKLHDEAWTALTFVIGLSLRLLAIRFHWELPKLVQSAALAAGLAAGDHGG